MLSKTPQTLELLLILIAYSLQQLILIKKYNKIPLTYLCD